MTIGSLGVIDVNQWNTKAPPSPPVGFKWKNEGKVILIPSDKFIPNYEYDSNTITEDHQNYEKLMSKNVKKCLKNVSGRGGFDVPPTPSYS